MVWVDAVDEGCMEGILRQRALGFWVVNCCVGWIASEKHACCCRLHLLIVIHSLCEQVECTIARAQRNASFPIFQDTIRLRRDSFIARQVIYTALYYEFIIKHACKSRSFFSITALQSCPPPLSPSPTPPDSASTIPHDFGQSSAAGEKSVSPSSKRK